MTGENGITRQNVRQRIISDPLLAQELGAFFAAERTTGTQTKSIGTFTVDGKDNGVLYGRLGTRDVNDRMAGNIDMVRGNTYTLDADGTIDKNGNWFGGNVSPTDSQQDRYGSRLQVAVTDRDGNVIDRQNFRPGMQISTDREGARLGFVFADGDLSDNSGHFNVNVRETSKVNQTTNVAIAAADADGIDRAGRTVVDALTTAPSAASLPDPDLRLARGDSRALQVDRSKGEIQTSDGYRFQFRDNEVRIDWPGRLNDGSPETSIRGRKVTEGDGTTWRAEDGNYILPNGAMFTLGYDDNGQIKNFTLVNGDSRVDVSGINQDDPRIGRVRDGGLEHRRRAVEDNYGGNTYRMGGYNDGWSELDISWNLERQGRDVGQLADGNWLQRGQPYVVDPELKPPFGTKDYERMLRSEIEDIRSAISGGAQAQGAERDIGRLIGDHLLGSDGSYDAYARELQASRGSREGGADSSAYFQQLIQQMWMQQMLGGIPEYHGNFDNAMGSLQMLQKLLAQQAAIQNEFAAGANPAQTFLPNYTQAQPQIDPSMLIDQVLRGIGERSQQSSGQPARNRLDRFDIGDRRARESFRSDPGAALLRSRMEREDPRTTIDAARVQELSGELRTKVNGDKLEDKDVERLTSLSTDERVAVMDRLTTDELKKFGDQLPDRDEEKSGQFLAALTRDAATYPDEVQRQMGSILDGIKQDGSSSSDNVLQQMQRNLGGGDVDSEGSKQQAAEHLANLGDENLKKMADVHTGGNTDEKELEVIGRARGIATGSSKEGSALSGELTRKVGDSAIDGALLNKLKDAKPEDRLAALAGLSSDERKKLADDAANHWWNGTNNSQMGDLMAELVRDANRGDVRANGILRDFTAGLKQDGSDYNDDVLQQMQKNLGGGDVGNAENKRRAARALSAVDGGTLDVMREIHQSGWADDKETAVIDLARELRRN